MNSTLSTGLLLFALHAATAVAAAPTLEPAWKVEGLSNPESVVLADSGEFYVSNVAGEGDAKDGVGFISRVTQDGKLLQREWVAGLNAPKGLALREGKLYASDITDLVVIDVAQAKIAARIPLPEAKFLNDVAFGPDGQVLVSDSAGARIYIWDGKEATIWLADEALRSVNGLLPEAKSLIVTTMQGKLLSVDWKDRKISTLAQDLGNADGVTRLDDGKFLVSEWPGRLFHVALSDEASTSTVIDSREQKIYLNDFLRVGDLLIAPNWEPSTLTAYRIVRQP